MRTTLAIDDDVLAAAKALAELQDRSLGEVISDLARRALRREKHELQKAAEAGDAAAFAHHAARAMSIAVAPHFPANPRALVSGDILLRLADAGLTGQAAETVKKVFAAADAQFAVTPPAQPDLLGLRPGVEAVLCALEEKL